MPAPRDDVSGASAQNQRTDTNSSNVEKQQSQAKNEPSGRQREADAGQASNIDEVGATEAAFRKAIGLDKVPLKGMVEFTVKRVEMEAQKAEGVSRAQNVCFTNQRGENLVGTQYSNDGATFFKTRSGEKYSVNVEPQGNYVLTSSTQSDSSFTAVKLTVLADQFAASVDNRILGELSTIAVNKPRMPQVLDGPPVTANVEQGVGRAREPVDAAALKQEIISREISAATGSEPPADKTREDKRISEAVNMVVTDQAITKPVGPASSLEAISGMIAGWATPAEVPNQVPEVRTPEAEGAPQAPPPDFDLDDIVEPKITVVRSSKTDKVDEPEVPAIEPSRLTDSITAEVDLSEEEADETAVNLTADEEAIRERINKAKQDRRRRYIVKDKDTLSSIAAKQLKDRRLGELIFEINKHVIPVKIVRGRPVRQLKSRMVIFLPTQAEIDEYRAALGGVFSESTEVVDETLAQVSENFLAEEALPGEQIEISAPLINSAGIQEGENSSPKIDRQEYIVRLGDTLKTIAMKHPALSEIGLWLLLAQVNELSTEVDGRGQPVAKLMRGNRIMIPTVAEIERFNQEQSQSRQSKNK